MKKIWCIIILLSQALLGQEGDKSSYMSFDYFRGYIYQHKEDITHLITGHPEGFFVSYNKRTFGDQEWEQAYNYPDYGFSFQYQDFKNESLGHTMALAAHYNFYFLKRHLKFTLSQGLAYTSHPHHSVTNHKNNAFGSRLLSANVFMMQYQRLNVLGNFGFQAGVVLTHFSNGRFKSPNSGINTIALNVGLNYEMGRTDAYKPVNEIWKNTDYSEPIHWNIIFRTGVNESAVVGMGQAPFYHISTYADKRFNRKSALQLGADVFFTTSLKEFIAFNAANGLYVEDTDPNTDYKRVGLFVGHELFINRVSIEAQLGYYIYKPFKYESDIYQRVGIKYYVTPKIFAAAALKTHGARAEAIEIGMGLRL